MGKSNFTITAHIVMSLVGFIAKKDNSISWFESTCNYEHGIDTPNSDIRKFGLWVAQKLHPILLIIK